MHQKFLLASLLLILSVGSSELLAAQSSAELWDNAGTAKPVSGSAAAGPTEDMDAPVLTGGRGSFSGATRLAALSLLLAEAAAKLGETNSYNGCAFCIERLYDPEQQFVLFMVGVSAYILYTMYKRYTSEQKETYAPSSRRGDPLKRLPGISETE